MDKENKTSEKKNKTDAKNLTRVIIIAAVVFVVLSAAVFFFGNNAYNRAIVAINSAHIEELAEHDVKIINSSISSRLGTLTKIADDIHYWSKKDGTSIKELLHSDSEFLDNADKITLVSDDGFVFSSNNVIESRPDVAEICANSPEKFVCRFDNTVDNIPDQRREYLLYGIRFKPVEVEGHTCSYLCCFIRPANLENELKMDTYGGQGFSSVIDAGGNYILNINRSHSFLDRDNFFEDFENVLGYASVEEFREALTTTTTARANAKIGSRSAEEYYLVFTPMEGVDWFFVSAVPSGVFELQSRNLMRIAALLLGVVALALAAVILFTVRSVRQQHELTEKAATDALNAKLQDQQAELEQALELAESANKAKTTFLFNMSHDIRTPMNAIIGFNNMAAAHLDEKETVATCLKKVGSSSRQLLSLINDVLDMARIESGTVKCEYEPTDLVESAEDLTDIVKQSVQKELRIEVDFSGVEHRFVLADHLHTDRILMNIISNSVKYTPEGGWVKFSVKELPSASSREGFCRYDFTVEDNGIGMSEEFLEHIYEEFSREKNSTVSGIQGTGLGMAITKKLVDLLGGTIDIQSKLGEGTKTTIHLEMETSDPGKIPEEYEISDLDDAVLRDRKVLLVEDNELNREIAVDILSEEGMIIDTAEDGDVAVEKMKNAEAGRYDIILMDIQMPKMNGYEATRAIRALPDPVVSAIPIIAMTANAFEEDRQNAFAAGMNGHVSKPIDIDRLKNAIAMLL